MHSQVSTVKHVLLTNTRTVIKLHAAQLADVTAVEAAGIQQPYSAAPSQIKTKKLQARWLSASAPCSSCSFCLSPPAKRRSADQFLLYFRTCGKGGLAEGESVAARLQLALARAHEVRLDQIQLRGGSRALGLRFRLARLRLIQRGG